ncbi:MAG: hypothetical protein ACQEQY_09750 [Halobacteriota archaeon]
MSSYRRVLALVARGIQLPVAADRLSLREDRVAAMVESMVRAGHLRDVGCTGDTCSACPMADGCSISQSTPSQYVVTAAGRSLLAEADDDVVPDIEATTAPASPSTRG